MPLVDIISKNEVQEYHNLLQSVEHKCSNSPTLSTCAISEVYVYSVYGVGTHDNTATVGVVCFDTGDFAALLPDNITEEQGEISEHLIDEIADDGVKRTLTVFTERDFKLFSESAKYSGITVVLDD